MITEITYEDVITIYEKLNISREEFHEKTFECNYFSVHSGDGVSSNRTFPYAEFVDVVCVSE